MREGGRQAIADKLDRLTALRAILGATTDAEVTRTVLALAYLLPGRLERIDGEELALGQVLGDELLPALDPPAES